MKNFFENNNYLRIALYALVVIIISILFYRISSNSDNIFPSIMLFFKGIGAVLSPIIYGLIIAYLFNPIVNFFEKSLSKLFKPKTSARKKQVRTLSIILLYLCLFGSIFLMIKFLIPQILVNIRDLVNRFPDYVDIFNNSLKTIEENVNKNIAALPYQMNTTKLFDLLSPEKYFDSGRLNTIIATLMAQAFNITSSLFNWIMGFVISFYALEQKDAFAYGTKKLTYALFKEVNAHKIVAVFKEAHDIFIKFFVGKFIDSLIIGVICFIGLSIMKNPYALLLAVIVGVFNMIPYFGPILGAVPAILITLFDGFLPALTVAIFILLLQQFDGLVLGPKILGDSIGLSPFWIISGIIVGGALWGPLGMFFASPLIAVILLSINRWMDKSLSFKKIIVHPTPPIDVNSPPEQLSASKKAFFLKNKKAADKDDKA